MIMKGELTKSYDRPLLINEEQFRNIASFIEDGFEDIEYKIYTSDGANYNWGQWMRCYRIATLIQGVS